MRTLVALAAVAGLTGPLAARLAAQTPEGVEYFEKHIRPVLAAKCYSCHAGAKPMAGIDLSSSDGLAKVVVKGDSLQSKLFQAIGYEGAIKMPPPGKLSEVEIAGFKSWIDMGAPAPAAAEKQKAAPVSVKIAEGRKHWAFQPVRDPAPPSVKNEAWVKTPIDRFILSKLEEKGVEPAAPISKSGLLRRVTYDLTGLPPTIKEIDAFLADRSEKAYAKVVDRLLASPQYGERWGRHWLDLARYADSTGMDEDHIYPHAWRYRDYVVRAFNDDLPYDQFVTEQIAGDLLPASQAGGINSRGVVATGFLALGPKPLAQQDRIKMIYDVVDEQIDTVSKAILGLTIACARCHDHKFDPILTKDYYSLASIFASTETFRNLGRPGSVSYLYYAPLDPVAFSRYQAHRWRMFGKRLEMEEALAEDWAREYGLLRPKVAGFLTAAWKIETKGAKPEGPDAKQAEKWARWLHSADEKARRSYLKKLLDATDTTIGAIAHEYQESYNKTAAKYDGQLENWRKRFASEALEDRDLPERPKISAEIDPFFAAVTLGGPMELPDSPRVAELRREWKLLQESLPPEPPMASGVRDGSPVSQRVFLHGDNNSPGDPVAKQFPVVLAGEIQTPVTHGSGRLELARWLTDPKNPLAARVMVNRIWQGHFGEALVRTPNNWGRMGETPTHPELLDYLASRFVESGWSIKAMHRLILLSNVYQEDSRASKQSRESDPGNRLWSQFNRTRMSVEQIRDSLLELGGKLDLSIGGSLLPLPGEKPAKGRPRLAGADDSTRRTLYLPVRRGSIPTVLATFDYGDATTPGDGRPRTNVAPQALFMMNSKFVIASANGFAKRLLDDAAVTDAQRLERAYWMALARHPEPAEVDSALTYIRNLERKIGGPEARTTSWRSFCHILISTNEFLYLN